MKRNKTEYCDETELGQNKSNEGRNSKKRATMGKSKEWIEQKNWITGEPTRKARKTAKEK